MLFSTFAHLYTYLQSVISMTYFITYFPCMKDKSVISYTLIFIICITNAVFTTLLYMVENVTGTVLILSFISEIVIFFAIILEVLLVFYESLDRFIESRQTPIPINSIVISSVESNKIAIHDIVKIELPTQANHTLMV